MKKRNEEYVSQFDFEKNLSIGKKVCQCCGNSVNEKNITKEGFCIECVMNNIAYNNINAQPNKILHKEFCKIVKKYNLKNVIIIVFVSLFSFGILGILLLINLINKPDKGPRKSKSFEMSNQTIVNVRNYNWVCPCCGLENQGPHYCEQCGVYPKFKLVD